MNAYRVVLSPYDFSVAVTSAVPPAADVPETGRGVRVPPLTVALVVVPLPLVVIAVGVVVLAESLTLILYPHTCSGTIRQTPLHLQLSQFTG